MSILLQIPRAFRRYITCLYPHPSQLWAKALTTMPTDGLNYFSNFPRKLAATSALLIYSYCICMTSNIVTDIVATLTQVTTLLLPGQPDNVMNIIPRLGWGGGSVRGAGCTSREPLGRFCSFFAGTLILLSKVDSHKFKTLGLISWILEGFYMTMATLSEFLKISKREDAPCPGWALPTKFQPNPSLVSIFPADGCLFTTVAIFSFNFPKISVRIG